MCDRFKASQQKQKKSLCESRAHLSPLCFTRKEGEKNKRQGVCRHFATQWCKLFFNQLNASKRILGFLFQGLQLNQTRERRTYTRLKWSDFVSQLDAVFPQLLLGLGNLLWVCECGVHEWVGCECEWGMSERMGCAWVSGWLEFVSAQKMMSVWVCVSEWLG